MSHNWTRTFRAMIAGAIAGIIPAILTRIAMRWITLDAGGAGEFTLQGTAGIFLAGVTLGVAVGYIYAQFIDSLPFGHWLPRALTFGLVMMIPAVPVLMFAQAGRLDQTSLLVQVMFYTAPFQYALQITGLMAFMRRQWPDWPRQPERRWLHIGSWVVAGVAGLFGVMAFVMVGFGSGLDETVRLYGRMFASNNATTTLMGQLAGMVFIWLLMFTNILIIMFLLRRLIRRLGWWSSLILVAILVGYVWLFAGPTFSSEAFRATYMQGRWLTTLALVMAGLAGGAFSRWFGYTDYGDVLALDGRTLGLFSVVGLMSLVWLFAWAVV